MHRVKGDPRRGSAHCFNALFLGVSCVVGPILTAVAALKASLEAVLLAVNCLSVEIFRQPLKTTCKVMTFRTHEIRWGGLHEVSAPPPRAEDFTAMYLVCEHFVVPYNGGTPVCWVKPDTTLFHRMLFSICDFF